METEKRYTFEEVEEKFGTEYAKMFNDINQYREFLAVLKDTILDPSDYQVSRDEDTGEISLIFMKKSGYYKLKKAFNVHIELVDWKPFISEKGTLKWVYFHVRGYYNGEVIDAFGSCDKSERGKRSSNDVIGTAHTRAIIRAISQSVDFGSVSDVEIANKGDNGE